MDLFALIIGYIVIVVCLIGIILHLADWFFTFTLRHLKTYWTFLEYIRYRKEFKKWLGADNVK